MTINPKRKKDFKNGLKNSLKKNLKKNLKDNSFRNLNRVSNRVSNKGTRDNTIDNTRTNTFLDPDPQAKNGTITIFILATLISLFLGLLIKDTWNSKEIFDSKTAKIKVYKNINNQIDLNSYFKENPKFEKFVLTNLKNELTINEKVTINLEDSPLQVIRKLKASGFVIGANVENDILYLIVIPQKELKRIMEEKGVDIDLNKEYLDLPTIHSSRILESDIYGVRLFQFENTTLK